MKVTLVQCTNTKKSHPDNARDMYAPSAYFRKQRAYAEATADEWFIQSAKYGLISPSKFIEPYDVSARDLPDAEEWAQEIAGQLGRWFGPDTAIEILGGRAYADPLVPELEVRGFDALEPLRGKQIGERMAWLDANA